MRMSSLPAMSVSVTATPSLVLSELLSECVNRNGSPGWEPRPFSEDTIGQTSARKKDTNFTNRFRWIER